MWSLSAAYKNRAHIIRPSLKRVMTIQTLAWDPVILDSSCSSDHRVRLSSDRKSEDLAELWSQTDCQCPAKTWYWDVSGSEEQIIDLLHRLIINHCEAMLYHRAKSRQTDRRADNRTVMTYSVYEADKETLCCRYEKLQRSTWSRPLIGARLQPILERTRRWSAWRTNMAVDVMIAVFAHARDTVI
jgi:hypothetical protein